MRVRIETERLILRPFVPEDYCSWKFGKRPLRVGVIIERVILRQKCFNMAFYFV